MGQPDLKRTQFKPCELITSSANSDRQELAFTAYFKKGDVVDVIAKDANGCQVGAALATGLTITAIEQDTALNLSAAIDTSSPPAGSVGYYFVAKAIDDGQNAVDRLYRCYSNASSSNIEICAPIIDGDNVELDTPIAGQSKHYVSDVTCLRAGDAIQLTCDSGLVGTANIVSVSIEGDENNNASFVILDDNLDTSGETGCKICTTSLTISDLFDRIKENIDKIDQPCENEFVGLGNCLDTVFDADANYIAGSSKLLLDGNRKRIGTPGTRATHSEGAGNAQLDFTSMILGRLGNEIEVEVVNAAGLAVTVTKAFSYDEDTDSFAASQYLIQVNSNSGAATAQQIADAINADADAQRLVQVQYGGDGTGVVTPFGPTALTGGLDDGTGDYAELAPIVDNEITLTGKKWMSFWILPTDANRMLCPPEDSEELVVDYRKALTNA